MGSRLRAAEPSRVRTESKAGPAVFLSTDQRSIQDANPDSKNTIKSLGEILRLPSSKYIESSAHSPAGRTGKTTRGKPANCTHPPSRVDRWCCLNTEYTFPPQHMGISPMWRGIIGGLKTLRGNMGSGGEVKDLSSGPTSLPRAHNIQRRRRQVCNPELHARAILERLPRTTARPGAHLNSEISAALAILGGEHHSTYFRVEDE